MEIDYNNIGININLLDEEIARQPDLMEHWSGLHAKASETRRKAQQALTVAKAKKAKDIRANKASYGLDKTTDTSIEQLCMLDPDIKLLDDAYINARYNEDVLKGREQAVEQRRWSLSDVVRLWVRNYYSEVPVDLYGMDKTNLPNATMKQTDALNELYLKRKQQGGQ